MANLVELFDNIVQMQNLNGVPLAAGKLYVYALGRTRLMDSWSDVDGESLNPNPIILDDAGQAHVYVSDDFDYTLVVCDQYNNEIFSLDKYLFSEGSHSHADVAVAPSEHIGVSSYHVGEVTVYVPYLTGEVGKVYEGIDPIVVNNDVNRISANHIPLGVQDPLYFVEDSETACIIGCSAQTEIPTELSGKWDEASDAVIANSAQWAEGTEYEAGSYVDIDGHTINVTGLQPAGNYQSAGDYVVHDELSSYATQDWVENQSYMKEYMESAFYPSTSNPSGYLTEHQDLSDYAKTEDLTAYQEKGNYYSASNPSGFINSDAISSMATTGFVADVSGDITALIPSTAGLATENWVSSQGYLTAHQSLDGLMSSDLLEISDNKITGYNGTAFAGQGGGVTGDFTLVEGNGIQLTDDPIAQTTTISVSGDYATNTQLQTVSGEITALIPSTAGLATEDWVTGQGYITNDAITGKQDITGMTAYATVESLTAKQDAGEYLSASDSANFLLTSDSGNFYPMNENPSGYLTAHQSLADYQTTADMVNYQTTAGMTAYLTGVPDTYLQNTDLSTTDGKVTAISGIPLSAGGDVPEGVMVESGLEYNAVNEISAYNGSAIAQYGAEKQWIVVDDTLLTLSNSAQFALGVNISAVAQLLGVDETVLWSGNVNISANPVITANEAVQNFEKVEFIGKGYPTNYDTTFGTCFFNSQSTDSTVWLFGHAGGSNGGAIRFNQCRISASDNILAIEQTKQFNITGTATTTGTTPAVLTKIIGIGRKA